MFAHRRDVMIEWGDCDPAGIVFYPRYFAIFDASTAALFAAALGFNKSEMLTRFGIIGIPMVDTGAKFLVPSKFGDVITIESRVTAFRRSSFDVSHHVYRAETLAIEAHETRVWAGRDPEDASRIKGVNIPPQVQAAFAKAHPVT
jgi:4-hydroxybenzoyl-CoA thioesterase